MRGRRVVITGTGAVSPYGEGVPVMMEGIRRHVCAVSLLSERLGENFLCRAGGLVPPLDIGQISRDLRRSMSPMSIFACLAAWEALRCARLPQVPPVRTGVAVGSTLGSPTELHSFFDVFLREQNTDSVRGTVFFKIMSHSAANNVALACGCTGRTLAPAAACASGLAGICLAYEAIASGRENLMLCGGADEFHLLVQATFDKLGAASHANPDLASRPFDKKRSGVVCSEGAGILVLESLESALERGVPVLAEVRGAAMTSSPSGIVHPDTADMVACMRCALEDARACPGDVGYVNAHATATEVGDIAEGKAIEAVFGTQTPVSSLKGHMGHTMAASGALESIVCIEMLRSSRCFPTKGLHDPDPRCGNIRHLTSPLPLKPGLILKNSFALGGSNCSVLFEAFH